MATIKKEVVTKEYYEELQAQYRRLIDVERQQVLEELDKLSERKVFFIGILIALSIYFFNKSSGRPFVSFPNKRNTLSRLE